MSSLARDLRTVVYLCPQLRCDLVPYAFYEAAAPNHLLDVRHVELGSYDADHGAKILAQLDSDVVRDADQTVQVMVGGSAYSFGFTWDSLLAALDETSARVGVPVLTDMVPTVDEALAAPAPIVVAHRLGGVSDRSVLTFLRSAGLECVGVVSEPLDSAANSASSLVAGAADADALVARAVAAHPEAATALLLGGSFWTHSAQDAVERDGRTFLNNLRAFARQFAPSTPDEVTFCPGRLA